MCSVQPGGSLAGLSHTHTYLDNFGVNGHFESHRGSEGKAQHGDAAAEDLRMFLQEAEGNLQQEGAESSRQQPQSELQGSNWTGPIGYFYFLYKGDCPSCLEPSGPGSARPARRS